MAAEAIQTAERPRHTEYLGAAAPEPVRLERRRFTFDEYMRMGELGIIGPDERVELLDGDVVVMCPIGDRHASRVDFLAELFILKVGKAAHVRVQNPVRIGDYSDPEPDIALLRRRDDFYAGARPGPDDVLLVVEVADTSLAADRQVKVPLYAGARIAEVWLLNVNGDALEVYRRPGPTGYAEVRRLQRGERIAPLLLPDLEVAVDELLG